MVPPGLDILDQDVHHEVLGQALGAEVLQQEAHVPEVEVGDATALGCHSETQVPVKPLGRLEVPGRNERLDFGDTEIGHSGSVRGQRLRQPASGGRRPERICKRSLQAVRLTDGLGVGVSIANGFSADTPSTLRDSQGRRQLLQNL